MDKSKLIEFDCIDAYTAGNPVRIVVGPKPDLKGKNMLIVREQGAGDEILYSGINGFDEKICLVGMNCEGYLNFINN